MDWFTDLNWTPEPQLLLIVCATFLLAGYVKGAIGLGLPTVAIAVLTVFVDLRDSVAIMILPLIISNLVQTLQGPSLTASLRRFGPMSGTFCVGLWAGTLALYAFDPRPMTLGLGTVLIVNTFLGFRFPSLSIPRHREATLSPAVGIVSGLIGGATGAQGIGIALYLQLLALDKDDFVQALGLAFFTSSFFLLGGLLQSGAFAGQFPALSLAAATATMIGMPLGQRFRDRIPQQTFRRIILIFLGGLGVNLIRKTILAF